MKTQREKRRGIWKRAKRIEVGEEGVGSG